MTAKPNLVVIGTGGTIAGRGNAAVNTSAYQCSVLGIDEVLASIPHADALANLRAEQLLQTGSENFGNAHLLVIGRRVSALLAQPDVDGVVIAHGTDTIEETAYFLHLTLKSAKPVVVVGSMRPPSALSSDAALNLYDALAVAADPASRGLGALVVVNDEIHTARDVAKRNSFKLEAFGSPYGPLGYVVEGVPRYYRRPARPHTLDTPWSADALDALPKVDVVHAYGALDRRVIDAIAADARGLIYAGTGNGNVSESLIGPLRDAARGGLRVVRASRTGSGVVVRNGAQPDGAFGWLTVDDQLPQKARILLMLALTQTDDPAALQAAFDRY
ncbi:asparaginase [Paraburkholderia caballeronis]|uniref:Glutamin-(Asparagin-)ase n=1 Tax=Paraburkholderia caballeronis TaxID=416943 RepID=A0A1H7LG75_9BURK|nr:asparaginase [Paraburkholderia caballeronis]PXW28449.1 glutamin-(asparagin-)ase [Paraburkholderia caballeronis]PXX03815.1 glutamin-(asparagin-)ase [Paraburkholderia caballeronis]RAK04559.1 glutamin-(asparagin-)ase [Paraburkholderia caballeronis]TDV19468.1 glutamin-(asparagin-)ase [Paraburkholderia caballeronis]TDV22068.1 glutamin-(asparagin-)ase [Paraburkholderia caballeronis]